MMPQLAVAVAPHTEHTYTYRPRNDDYRCEFCPARVEGTPPPEFGFHMGDGFIVTVQWQPGHVEFDAGEGDYQLTRRNHRLFFEVLQKICALAYGPPPSEKQSSHASTKPSSMGQG